MGFSDSDNLQHRTRTFTWTPQEGQQGVYPITVTATDGEPLSTSVTFVVFVGNFNEAGNGGVHPPPSQGRWHIAITNLAHQSGTEYRLVWSTDPDVAYDVFQASTYPGGNWNPIAQSLVTTAISNSLLVNHGGTRSFFKVMPSGQTPLSNGIWAVMSPEIPANFSMQAPPLAGDRDFAGAYGDELAEVLPANSEAYLLNAGITPSYTTLRLNSNGDWIHLSGPVVTELDVGQGFMLYRPSAGNAPVRVGPIDEATPSFQAIANGYNLVSISHGRARAASTAFETANPYGDPGGDGELSDKIILLEPSGAWRQLIRRSNGTWYDTGNPNSQGNTSLQLEPGRAYFYLRRQGATTVTF
jgi:hypothetical protein